MAADHNCFSSAMGDFTLTRASRTQSRTEQNLQAWDAADELLLSQLAEMGLTEASLSTVDIELRPRVLVANDTFGALVTALPNTPIDFCTDSFLSERAAHANLAANTKPALHIHWHTSLDQPTQSLDYLLIKLPKNLSLLEDQLYRYRSLCNGNTQVIAAGMVKHMSTGAFSLFEKLLGPTHTSLAKKKARLIFCRPDAHVQRQGVSPYPLRYKLEDRRLTLHNHANVFSREALDIGTRFFLEQLPHDSSALKVADLGCGNGLVGLVLAQHMPQAKIDFFDESYMALASARDNIVREFPVREGQCHFVADDGMGSASAGSYDKIFCNPPFHQHNVVGDFVATQMFYDARRALKSGGELWVVGNRHLGYHVQLKRLFGNLQQIASNQKFVVLRVVKP